MLLGLKLRPNKKASSGEEALDQLTNYQL